MLVCACTQGLKHSKYLSIVPYFICIARSEDETESVQKRGHGSRVLSKRLSTWSRLGLRKLKL